MRYTVWMVNTPGGPFQRIEQESKPLAGNEVLVRISASGVNPLDIKVRSGKSPHHRQPLPAVLGVDMAGTVEEVGPGVTAFKPGDEVYGMVGGVGGLQGTLAEFIVADADLVARKPENLSFRESAALPACIITAWEGLVDRANVRARQKYSSMLAQAASAISQFSWRARSERKSLQPSRPKRSTLWNRSELRLSTIDRCRSVSM